LAGHGVDMVKKPSRHDDTTEVLDAPEVLTAPPLKWASWPGNNGLTTAQTTMSVGTITGTGTGGQAPGAIAVGDLLIVAATAGLAGGIQDFTISGSGWTQILNSTAGDDEIKTFVWWKNATSADVTAAGVYTVTFGTSQPEAYSWAEWNFGQNAFVDAWNGLWSNVPTATNGLNPACFPTGSADTLLTWWFNYHSTGNWTLPGGGTSVFNNTQGGLPSHGASDVRTLSAAGFTGNLVATPSNLQQYGAFQIAISTGAPPNGGGGNSPIKWMTFQATQPAVTLVSSVIAGQQAIGQTPGPFAAGDLYVVACMVEADTGAPGALSISGTGWTNVIATAAGAPLNARLSVWAKTVSGGETGIYTVSWPNATGNPLWCAWNLGQATFDVANGQCVAQSGTSVVAPSVTTTAANENVLAYWFLVDTATPGNGVFPPSTAGLAPLAINLQGTNKWDMSAAAFLAPTAGATGNLTATSVSSGMPVYGAFQLAFKPTAGGSPPPVPTGLTATAVSSSQINLSWNPSTGATSYVVLRGGTSVGTPSGTTFNNTGLAASTSYTYTVEAVSSGGTSAPSSPASATTFSSSSPFPAFTPIYPPPPVGADKTVPNFPPPTPPPIGTVPLGDLVGPAVASASSPPSVAGINQPVFGFGDATHPPASAAFPEQTTTYPSPPIVFSNVYTGGSTPVTPPSTASTPPLGTSYNTGGVWGPPIGPALPPVVPGGTRPFMTATNGDPDDTIYEAESEQANSNENSNHVVYNDDDEDDEDWVEDETEPNPPTPPRPARTSKPKRGRSHKK
jgi:hypothetical protein